MISLYFLSLCYNTKIKNIKKSYMISLYFGRFKRPYIIFSFIVLLKFKNGKY